MKKGRCAVLFDTMTERADKGGFVMQYEFERKWLWDTDGCNKEKRIGRGGRDYEM